MVTSIIQEEDKAFHFVYNERILLNNFLHSLVEFHNREKAPLLPPFFVFKDEDEYVAFCIINDIKFESQVWFKAAYIRTDIFTAFVAIKEASVIWEKISFVAIKQKPQIGKKFPSCVFFC